MAAPRHVVDYDEPSAVAAGAVDSPVAGTAIELPPAVALHNRILHLLATQSPLRGAVRRMRGPGEPLNHMRSRRQDNNLSPDPPGCQRQGARLHCSAMLNSGRQIVAADLVVAGKIGAVLVSTVIA